MNVKQIRQKNMQEIYKKRNSEIYNLYCGGGKVEDIAKIKDLTRARVYQIIKEMKKQKEKT